jgi:hypothetical protein
MLMKWYTRAALPLLFTMIAAIAAITPSAAAAAVKPAPSLVVSRLTMDAYSPGLVAHTPPLRSPKLTKGSLYVITVQGTVSFYAAVDYLQIQLPFSRFCGAPQKAPLFSSRGGSGPVSNDAEFIFAQPVTVQSCASLKLPHAYPNFQVNNGFGWGHPKLLTPAPLRRPTANHAYSFAVVGQGRPLGLELVDPDTRDDYGSFQITIRHALASDCAHGQWRAFALKRAAICAGDTAHTTGTVPKLAKVTPLTISQGPIAHVVRDSDFPSGTNRELPSGALSAAGLARNYAISGTVAAQQTATLTGHGYRSGAISGLTGAKIPSVTSTAIQFATATGAAGAYTALVALDAGANAPAQTTATVTAATGIGQASVITYAPASPGGSAGTELIAVAGDSVYVLRELQSAGSGPISAATVQSLLATLITR